VDEHVMPATIDRPALRYVRRSLGVGVHDDDVAARKTYRYVRLGMIGAIVLLGAAILLEHHNVDWACSQTSISAYYYTPARAVFVGALMAIGLSLIVIKGSSWQEDVCLNVAGMLAPIVALVPTSDHGTCWSIEPDPLPTIPNPKGDDPLQEWVIANISNNVQTLLFAGAVSLLGAGFIAGFAMGVGKVRHRKQRQIRSAWNEHRGTILGLVVGVVLLGFCAVAFYRWRDVFNTRAHGFAAAAMFGFLALAAAANGWDARNKSVPLYVWFYFGTAGLMAATALLMFKGGWDHKVLLVEILEIIWFVGLWSAQSKELWDDTLRRPPTTGRVSPHRQTQS
jgi:hypothetical protein